MRLSARTLKRISDDWQVFDHTSLTCTNVGLISLAGISPLTFPKSRGHGRWRPSRRRRQGSRVTVPTSRRTFAAFLVSALLLPLSACGSGSDGGGPGDASGKSEGDITFQTWNLRANFKDY